MKDEEFFLQPFPEHLLVHVFELLVYIMQHGQHAFDGGGVLPVRIKPALRGDEFFRAFVRLNGDIFSAEAVDKPMRVFPHFILKMLQKFSVFTCLHSCIPVKQKKRGQTLLAVKRQKFTRIVVIPVFPINDAKVQRLTFLQTVIHGL